MNNDKVVVRAFEGPEAMGAAIDKGDIAIMARAMSPEQINRLDAGRRRSSG
ncbi:hypothetical protein [Streptomyces wuyuanensis]|uniref:Peptide/nickel transport system substrate-binding protein n=1 Tax=Streptomyces wuyuanensis TaxID=1196353 RepID=A0A1H0DQM6_9ACTN|nr:hypothetical protein [Streptomyces wuyuanensis]SDN72474.1 peptide/nickel transport system substrate-binding protein [Streptomyces wuyuanensis]